VVIEAGVPDGWYRFESVREVIGMESFGESAPAKALYEFFGITVDHVVSTIQRILA
jgi:transketolase